MIFYLAFPEQHNVSQPNLVSNLNDLTELTIDELRHSTYITWRNNVSHRNNIDTVF